MSKTWFTDTDPNEAEDAPFASSDTLPTAGPAGPAPTASPLPRQGGGGFMVPGYHPVRLLGRGGMGEVWLADRIGDAGVKVRCALKVILPERETEQSFRRHFLNEARMAARLRHPNVVGVFDVGQAEDRLYIAMEWVDGTDARGLIRRLRSQQLLLPMKHALYILRSALQGLHYAQTMRTEDGRRLKLVHRDISPENLLISREGAVKVADFGVAWTVTSGTTPRAIGKLHYFAPELLTGAPASPRSDLFALGVTFYELLTMEPLFNRKAPIDEVRRAVKAFDPRSIFDRDLSLPDELEDILMRCLAPDPHNRYASALEMLEDVNDYAYEAGIRLLDAHFARYIGRLLERG
jgi:serine/threonine protein kinase